MATNSLQTRLVLRNDTAAAWLGANPKLLAGEIGIENDTGLFKIGDGANLWADLAYANKFEDGKASHYEGTAEAIPDTEPVQYETDKQVIDRVLGDKTPVQDDVIIVKRLIADDKYSYTAYMYNGLDWAALDGNYSAENVYFDEDLLVTANVGVVKIDEETGSTTLAAKGKNLETVLASILASEENPDVGEPSVTVSLDKAGSYEVGTTLTPKYTAELKPGSYEFGPATGVVATSWDVKDNLSTPNTYDVYTETLPELQVIDGMNYKVTATATYDDAAIPVTNFGNEYAAGQIKAGSKSGTSSAITGYRSFFYGALPTTTAEAPVTSALIRGLTNGKAYNAKKTLTVKANLGDNGTAKRIIVAYPANTTRGGLSEVLLTSSQNATVTGQYKEKTNVTVLGVNDYDGIEYKVFVYEPASLLASEVHQITLA